MFLLGQDLIVALAAAAQPFTPTGAGSSAGVATGFSAGFSSGASFSQSHPSLRQARTVPIFVFFSTINGAPHFGHGSAIGMNGVVKSQSGYPEQPMNSPNLPCFFTSPFPSSGHFSSSGSSGW